jgi:putative ABC transport system permease protein
MSGNPSPRLGRLLLRLALRGEGCEYIVGDIDEEFSEHILPERGWLAAHAWYWSQVLRTVGDRALRVSPSRKILRPKGDRLMSTTWMDIKHSLRGLIRTPGFALIAIVTLALGIGANTAIFSVVYAVLLQPLPFGDPDQLVRVYETRPDRGWDAVSLSRPNFRDYREQNSTLEDMGAMTGTDMNLTGTGFPERVRGAMVSAGFFSILQVAPVVGRTFALDEDEPGAETRVALLGHEFWTTRFASDPAIAGKTLTLDDENYTVVGVLPPGEPWLDRAQVFVPMVRNPEANRGNFILGTIARLKPGISIDAARADLEAIAERLSRQYPELQTQGRIGMRMDPASDWVASDSVRRALWVLLGAVGFLLLIACVNLANLLLARATARQRETAVRAALGANRGRMTQQLLAESLTLGVVGAGVGLLLAVAAIRLVRTLDPGGIPRLAAVSLNGWVLGFTLVVGLLSGVVAGLVPAFQVPYDGLLNALRDGDRSATGGIVQKRLRSVLVGVEVALSLILLVGAGLLIRSFGELSRVDRGFQTENRLFFSVTLPPTYDEGTRGSDLINQFIDRIDGLPQVVDAAAVHIPPLSAGSTGMGIVAADRADEMAESVPWAGWRLITDDYFRTLGLPLLKGRTFTDSDIVGEPWQVVVSERLANLLWPDQDPIGRQAVLWSGQNDLPAEVIGVVGNMRERGLDNDPALTVYIPYGGASWSPYFVVHTAGDPLALVPSLRPMLAELDPNLPIANIRSFDDMVSSSVATRKFNMMLLAVFAGLALLLALAGIYGVQSYMVTQRTSEIGIRVALGASGGSVIRQIVTQGMIPTVVGIGLGALGAFSLSRFLASLLFGIAATDVVTYVGVGALLALTGLLSCYVPARRALKVDPITALREE